MPDSERGAKRHCGLGIVGRRLITLPTFYKRGEGMHELHYLLAGGQKTNKTGRHTDKPINPLCLLQLEQIEHEEHPWTSTGTNVLFVSFSIGMDKIGRGWTSPTCQDSVTSWRDHQRLLDWLRWRSRARSFSITETAGMPLEWRTLRTRRLRRWSGHCLPRCVENTPRQRATSGCFTTDRSKPSE